MLGMAMREEEEDMVYILAPDYVCIITYKSVLELELYQTVL
jgi:hypothetical protein